MLFTCCALYLKLWVCGFNESPMTQMFSFGQKILKPYLNLTAWSIWLKFFKIPQFYYQLWYNQILKNNCQLVHQGSTQSLLLLLFDDRLSSTPPHPAPCAHSAKTETEVMPKLLNTWLMTHCQKLKRLNPTTSLYRKCLSLISKCSIYHTLRYVHVKCSLLSFIDFE